MYLDLFVNILNSLRRLKIQHTFSQTSSLCMKCLAYYLDMKIPNNLLYTAIQEKLYVNCIKGQYNLILFNTIEALFLLFDPF